MPFEKVLDGVHLVGGQGLSSPGDCCVYLVDVGGEGAVLVDAGLGTEPEQLISNIEDTGHRVEDIEVLVLTHCHIDHIGGAPSIVERAGCQVMAHEGDVEAITEGIASRTAADAYGVPSPRVPVDRVVTRDGGTLDVGSTHMLIVHTPGHTPGDITLQMGIEGRTLVFANDVHGPFRRAWGSDLNAWRRSMGRLIAIAPDILLEGHFGVIRPRSHAVDFIREYLESDMRML